MKVTRLNLVTFESTCLNRDIARTCRMQPSRFTEYRLGQRDIPIHHLINLCQFFQVPPHSILGWVEMDEPIRGKTA